MITPYLRSVCSWEFVRLTVASLKAVSLRVHTQLESRVKFKTDLALFVTDGRRLVGIEIESRAQNTSDRSNNDGGVTRTFKKVR